MSSTAGKVDRSVFSLESGQVSVLTEVINLE